MKSIIELHNKIVNAIKNGKKDLRLIKNEQYQRDEIIRDWLEMRPATRRTPICCLNRRRLLCNAYACYCGNNFLPLVADDKQRGKLILEIIDKHFLDL